MESLAALYKNHIVTLQERTRDALARFKLDALLIHSGELVNVFLDDHPYPFKVNPQFKAWVPVTQVPTAGCWWMALISLSCGSTCRWITGTTLSRCRPLSGPKKLKLLRCQKPTVLVASCLLPAAISGTSARYRNVRCSWTLLPATSTRKG